MSIFNSLIRLLSVFFLTCFSFSLALASDFHSPRTEALGGAGHAGSLLSDAIYLNPAAGSYIKSHSLSVNYQADSGNGHIFNASVLDGTEESLFQAGLSYTSRVDANLIHVGASKSILSKMGIGIGGKFIFPNDNSGQRVGDATFSAIGIFAKWFQASLVIDNIMETASGRGFLREYIIGTKINVDQIILVYIDPHYVPSLQNGQNQFGIEAGIEFPFFTDVFLRMGTFTSSMIPYQNQRGDGYGIGLGWLAPKISLDYSFSRVIGPTSSLAHTFGMTIYF
ncbi:MAG: hypothetical protein HYX41_02345 [Bdellovibrio sp.]|nr:hypothetical protein [Bdellovibrio sp.]